MAATITLYTVCWNNYWDNYGEKWAEYVAKFNTQPDEIIIVSDSPIDISGIKHSNVKNVVSVLQDGEQPASKYRNTTNYR